MAGNIHYNLQARDYGIKIIAGHADIGGTGAITATTGKGFTIERDGTGAYTIALDGTYSDILYADVRHIDQAAGDTTINMHSITATQFEIEVATAGTAEDPANGDKLAILIICKA